MSIISYNYLDVFSKVVNDALKDRFNFNVNLDSNSNILNYMNIMSELDIRISKIAVDALKNFLEDIDENYKNSNDRKNRYHIKAYHDRSILTIFGEVTIRRTFYSDKNNQGSYCYLDDLLNLKKYDYFDPYIKSMIVDNATRFSYSKVGKIISDMIGKRVNLDNKKPLISKQTVRNTLLNNKVSDVIVEPKTKTPETLFIMFDEKFISTQNNDGKDIMMKHAVVFEGIRRVKNSAKRNELIGKYSIATKGYITDKVLDYINDAYDVDKIKTIYIMGDGAGWIKSQIVHFYFGNNQVKFSLDKYHFKQALRHITLNDDLSEIALSYILNYKIKYFKSLCDEIIDANPHRKITISEKQKYILNNISAIRLSYNQNLKCSMEGHISHNLADLFSSRPKGYAKKTLEILTDLRMKYKNGLNIKELFLHNYNEPTLLIKDKEELDWSMFERDESETYSYGRVAQIGLSRKSYYKKML